MTGSNLGKAHRALPTTARVSRTRLCSTSAGLIAFAALGLAAGTPAQAQQAAGGDAANQIGEVVVTAQFRSQNVQKTPLAITAVNATMMEARSQTNVSDVASRAPSVTFTTAGGGLGGSQAAAINIRGVGQTDFNLALEPGVGTYIDDVYFGTMYGTMMDLLDLDRVEILRGPQGTLSGKNSEGGAVKLFSKQPSDSGGGYVEASYGSFNKRMLRAGFNLTLIPEKVFLRVTGLGEKQDGYVTRYDFQCKTGLPADQLNNVPSMMAGGPAGCKLGTEGGKDVLALRAALRLVLSDRVEDTITFDDTRDRSEPPPTVLLYQGSWHGPNFNLLASPPVPNLAANFVPPAGSYYNYGTYTGLVGTPYQYTLPAVDPLNAWGVSNVLNIKLADNLSLKSISAIRKMNMSGVDDGDGSPMSRIMNLWTVDYTQYTQELRLSGSVGTFADWTVGGFYFRSEATQGGRISIDGAADNLVPFFVTTDFLFNDPVKVESKSAFAHVELHPTDRLTVTGGVRYTDDYKSYGFSRTFAPGYPPSFIDLSIAATDGAVGVFRGSRWDYRATAAYQVTSDVNVYAQFATGFKGGGVDPRPYYLLQVQPFGPETVNSYELGLKSELFDHHMRLNLAAFYNKYKGIQLILFSCPQFVPPGAPPNCALPANVGNATIKGAEAEAEIRPMSNMLIDASASYVDFSYDSVDPATNVLLTDKPPFTPAFKLSAGVQYEFDLMGHGTLTPRLDYLYQSQQYAYARNFPNDRIGGYGLANFRLTYRDPSHDWQVGLSVTNLFDKYYFLSKFDATFPQANPASYDYVSGMPGHPREFSVSVKRTF